MIMDISCLAEELLEHILSHLSVVKELQTASQVNQLWRKISRAVYREKYRQFREGAQQGRFVWRLIGPSPQQPRTLHFVPKHVRRRNLSQQHLNIPAPRCFPHCVFYGNSIYLHGGVSDKGTGKSYFNDMHRYDLLTHAWQKVATSGTTPTPRSNTSIATFRNTIVLTGGSTYANRHSIGQTRIVHSDIFLYNLSKSEWQKSEASLSCPHSDHVTLFLGDPDIPKLVVTGGTSGNFFGSDMVQTVELYHFNVGDDGRYIVTPGKKFPFLSTRLLHCMVQIDTHTALLYGGRTPHADQVGRQHFRTDAYLLCFNQDFTAMESVRVSVKGQDVYNGLYPAFVHDFARVNNSVIFFQKSIYLKPNPDYDAVEGIWDLDEQRKPTGDEIYRQDYFHTFILDISAVRDTHTIHWVPVTKNPPLLAPRFTLLHATVHAGDALYVFGGSVVQRSREPEASSNLYKITVLKDVVR